ncbi:hypothetical protein L1987_38246 [Smallanthus sonchifolius]|uniref:Uncharacterized protein n=1 Tax=Smallanthus sonchifolius TaxID=185202 RepID=A0ACB9HKF3_9ASTR|nr:hypothetical protein L1987_38246 [Smallanthus sonchifolius]
MAYLGVQMLMEKLKQLINCNDIPSINHPAIIRERPQFQLLYDELDNPMIQTLFIGQHQDLERVNDLKKRFTDAAEEAQYIIDLFLSHVLDRNDDFNPSLNLDDVWRSLESVTVEFMSMRSVTMKMDSSPRPDRMLNQSAAAAAAAAPVSFTRNSQGSKKLTDEIFVGLDHDLELIRDKLVEDRKKLDVVSIVAITKDMRMPNRGMNRITLPATLKALTLHGCYLPWSDMSIIQSLPNLQVLKLRNDAFVGSCWNTDGQEFRQLRFLRLEKLYIKQWEVCSPSFPCLRQLEIIKCSGIEEIPLEFGEIPTLELIKIKRWPDSSFDESVRRIQQEQHDAGNYDLKIHIINSISLYVWTTDVSEDWDDYRQLQGEVNGIKYSCSIE